MSWPWAPNHAWSAAGTQFTAAQLEQAYRSITADGVTASSLPFVSALGATPATVNSAHVVDRALRLLRSRNLVRYNPRARRWFVVPGQI